MVYDIRQTGGNQLHRVIRTICVLDSSKHITQRKKWVLLYHGGLHTAETCLCYLFVFRTLFKLFWNTEIVRSSRDSVKPITMTFVFAASVNWQHFGETVSLGIRILCPSGATCLPTDCCFSESAL